MRLRLFLDTSVLLAACGSASGSSRALFDYAHRQGWTLLASPWVLGEVVRNLSKLSSAATAAWAALRPRLVIVDDIVSLDRIVIFPVAKDRPVLLTALAAAQILLTLDHEDFAGLLGHSFYGMPIIAPADFLLHERATGRL